MEITQREIAPHKVVISVTGKVMLGTESEKITDLVDTLLAAGNRTFVFDIAGVTVIDSTGIGRFIASYNRIASKGGGLVISGASGNLFQAFHVCRLDTVFRFYPTVDDAVQAVA